jgi:hypothetical protein
MVWATDFIGVLGVNIVLDCDNTVLGKVLGCNLHQIGKLGLAKAVSDDALSGTAGQSLTHQDEHGGWPWVSGGTSFQDVRLSHWGNSHGSAQEERGSHGFQDIWCSASEREATQLAL